MSRPKITKAEIQEALEYVGAIAEMCVVFYHAALDAGANKYEAAELTRVYIAASFTGRVGNTEREQNA